MLKCKCCGKSVSLEGIMNLQPLCPGDKPWEGIGQQDYAACMQKNKRSTMKWALVTSNSVYYAENFSSLYIPDDYRTGANVLDEKLQKVLTLMTDKWFDKYVKKHAGATKQDYLDHCYEDDFESIVDYVISKFPQKIEVVEAHIDLNKFIRLRERKLQAYKHEVQKDEEAFIEEFVANASSRKILDH